MAEFTSSSCLLIRFKVVVASWTACFHFSVRVSASPNLFALSCKPFCSSSIRFVCASICSVRRRLCWLSFSWLVSFSSKLEVRFFISESSVLHCWTILLISSRNFFSPSIPIFGPILIAMPSPHLHNLVIGLFYLLPGSVADGFPGCQILDLARKRDHRLYPAESAA